MLARPALSLTRFTRNLHDWTASLPIDESKNSEFNPLFFKQGGLTQWT